MALKPFPGFKSITTHHCVTGSMLHIFKYHNIPVSEEMLLGLGSGVGFIYWHQKGVDPFIGGRANIERPGEEGLERTVSGRLGVKFGSYYTSSSRKVEVSLMEFLKQGQPVMLQVDMGFLPYFDFGGEEYHFGYHVIVVGGFDPETREVLIADRDLEFHPVSWELLSEARGSTYKPFPPRNHWYTFDFNNFHQPNSKDLLLSIQVAATGMLEPKISNFGVKGIQKAARRILRWPTQMDFNSLRRTCFNTYVFIDSFGGTGGGIFRYMYGRFLKEAADIVGISEMRDIGKEFELIGDRWQDVAQIFRKSFDLDEPSELLPETTQPLLDIAEMEQDAWGRLLSLSK